MSLNLGQCTVLASGRAARCQATKSRDTVGEATPARQRHGSQTSEWWAAPCRTGGPRGVSPVFASGAWLPFSRAAPSEGLQACQVPPTSPQWKEQRLKPSTPPPDPPAVAPSPLRLPPASTHPHKWRVTWKVTQCGHIRLGGAEVLLLRKQGDGVWGIICTPTSETRNLKSSSGFTSSSAQHPSPAASPQPGNRRRPEMPEMP